MTGTPTTAFSTLNEREQALLLASFSHQLTILAREGYAPGTERFSDPELVRRINEIQHRVASAIMARLSSSNRRYPDADLINIIVGSGADAFSKRLQSLFHRAWWIAFANELVDDLYL